MKRTTNGSPIYLYYDGWNLIEEHNAATVVLNRFIHGAGVDEILARFTASGGAVYFHQDALGSTVALTDQSGNVVERYKYDVFGAASFFDGAGNSLVASNYASRFLFTGREYIPELGVYDYRNRFYSPTVGRFLQTDPLRSAGGDVNFYRYAANAPTNFTDPMGLFIGDKCGIEPYSAPIERESSTDCDSGSGSEPGGGDSGDDEPEFLPDILENGGADPGLPESLPDFDPDLSGLNRDNSITVRSTFYNATERGADPDTIAGRSSTGTPLGWAGDGYSRPGIAAVDPALIPYGSTITTSDGRQYIAADTGGAVRHQTASSRLTPVVDFYSNSQVGHVWDRVTVNPYTGMTPYPNLPRNDKGSLFGR